MNRDFFSCVGSEKTSFFRENKEVFFADNINKNTSNAEQNSGSQSAEESKQPDEVLVKIRQKEVKELVAELIKDPENTSVQSKIRQCRASIEGRRLLNKEAGTLSVSDKKKITDILEGNSSMKEVQPEEIQALKYKGREGKKFEKSEIATLRKVPIASLLEAFSDSEKKNFFLSLSKTSFKGKLTEAKHIYENWQNDIKNILDESSLDFIFKEAFFENFCRLRGLSVGEQNSVKNRSAVLTEEAIKNSGLQKKYLKILADDIEEAQKVHPALEAIAFKEKSQEEREREMYQIVKNSLGEDIAKSAEKTMNQNAEQDEQSRQNAFFEAVKKHSFDRVKLLEGNSISFFRKEINKSEHFLFALISLFTGLTDSEKIAKQKEIKDSYQIFYTYLNALDQSHAKQNRLPLLQFLMKSKDENDTEINNRISLEVLSKKDVQIAMEIENQRKKMQAAILIASSKYHDDSKKLNKILNSLVFKNADFNEKIRMVQELNVLSARGIKEMIVPMAQEEDHTKRTDKDFKAYYFLNVEKLQKEYAFSDDAIKKAIAFPMNESITRKVIEKLAVIGNITEDVTPNVIQFFKEDRITEGLSAIAKGLADTEIFFINKAEQNGWLDKGIDKRIAESYEKTTNKETIEGLLENKK